MKWTSPAATRHIGDIELANGNLRIDEGATVVENIFIEEGDFFIASRGGVESPFIEIAETVSQ